jgi:hypothetical protein
MITDVNGNDGFGGGRMAPNGTQRRVLVKDLEVRVRELDDKLGELSEQMLKLDQRIQTIANLIATAQAARL